MQIGEWYMVGALLLNTDNSEINYILSLAQKTKLKEHIGSFSMHKLF